VVEDTETSDLYKSSWEDVPGKSAQELHTTESDVPFSRSLSVIPGNKGHFFISDIHDTLVSDGNPMGILIDSFSIGHPESIRHPGRDNGYADEVRGSAPMCEARLSLRFRHHGASIQSCSGYAIRPKIAGCRTSFHYAGKGHLNGRAQ